MNSMVTRDIGRDAADMATDVRRFESTGRTRDNTWADSRNKKKTRYMKNTMGYQNSKMTVN